MANRRKVGARDAANVKERQETEAAMGVERGSPTSRRIARGIAKGGTAATAARRLARIEREKRAGSRGPFKRKRS